MENQLNKMESHHNDYDSKAIIKFSSDPKTIQVAHLQFHMNLSASILSFMKNDTESYGIRRGLFQSDGLWSFQTAHVFPDIIRDNIDTASMIVHRIEDTLLIDNYDVDNNLIAMRDDRAWLNNIFNSNNLESSDLKENCFTHDVKCFKVTQDETFVSWVLHCSNGDLTDYDKNNQLKYKKILPFSSSWLGVSLPELTQDDKYPTKPITHRMYHQYMLSAFEGLHLLTGSDLVISSEDNDSQLTLRLRDMSKPMNVLTGMDYWLDNLVCNVNELMCHHLNGIVKYNKTVLTEDIPHLKGSMFSPNNVKDTAENFISFLKSNATNKGHTYWLFKEKNSDVLKLYDLTFSCSDGINRNQFTLPIAMLLYRVVRNVKLVQKYGGPSNSNLNHTILINCLKLFNETKYPEIVASVCYLLSDIFIPININVKCPDLEDLVAINPVAPDDNANKESSSRSHYKNGVCLIGVNNVLQPSRERDEYPKFKKLKSKPAVLIVENRCEKALYYVERGLTSLNYKKKPDVLVTNEKNVEKVVVLATSVDRKTGHKKNRRGKKRNKAVENNKDTVCNPQHSLQCIGSKTHICDEAIKFFDKACTAFTVIAEQNYLALHYGKALKNFQSAYRCQMFISTINGDEDQCGYQLERVSVCCLLILLNWSRVEQYIDEMNAPDDCYNSAIKIFLGTDCEVCNNFTNYTFIPDNISTKKCLLDSAESCYNWAMKFGMYDHDEKDLFKTLIGSVFVKVTTGFMKEVYDALAIQNADRDVIQVINTLNEAKLVLDMGIKMLNKTVNVTEVATLYMNMGKWNRYSSQLYVAMSLDDRMSTTCIVHVHQAIDWYTMALDTMGRDRSFNPELWDEAFWEMFSVSYDLAIEKHRVSYAQSDTVPIENEQEVIELLSTCLKYCDLENNTPYLEAYKFQTADINELLADMFHFKLRINSPISDKTRNQGIRDCISHYTVSCEMFLKINRPVESLSVINSLISVDQLRFRGTKSARSAINMFVSVGNTLRKCVPVLKTVMATKDSAWHNNPLRGGLRDQQISKLLQNIQNVLKTTIKGVMGKNDGLMEKLKPVYRESMTKKDEEHEISHLIRIIIEIIEII